ncbi:MAG: AAA family ATPase [Candidatus Aenigmarchaeota archaeon]|nr:AAA family ATPase [Candidatus Aenigmarchaeota archaeon]
MVRKSKKTHKKAKLGKKPRNPKPEYIKSGINGLDRLFTNGIPKNSSVLIAGGAGSGKTLLCLQIAVNAAKNGKKCLYMSFEESEEKLKSHIKKFGWDLKDNEKNLVIKRYKLFDITRAIDALLAKEMGDLLIDIKPILIPKGFKPEIIIVDSLTAIASAFLGREETYRIYIEQLFRYFEELKVTSFLISETEQEPRIYSPTGVEEFLADGVIVLYNIRRGNVRQSGLEVLKMRGTKHQKKVVAMQITDKKGIEIYPEQEVFSIFKLDKLR